MLVMDAQLYGRSRDLRQLTLTTARAFCSFGISDIDSPCSVQRPGVGDVSADGVNVGGQAFDVYAFEGPPPQFTRRQSSS
ncbi:hypothetical protein AES38_15075 (plasmid) [Clavibacter capsici]|nr:hypothetical protein AES38_15075 [Clavibacter capsici]